MTPHGSPRRQLSASVYAPCSGQQCVQPHAFGSARGTPRRAGPGRRRDVGRGRRLGPRSTVLAAWKRCGGAKAAGEAFVSNGGLSEASRDRGGKAELLGPGRRGRVLRQCSEEMFAPGIEVVVGNHLE